MVRMFFANVFDGKIVDYEYKGDGSEGVEPKSWRVASLVISMDGESFCEKFVGEDAGLGQSIHAFLDFNINVTVVGKGKWLYSSWISWGMRVKGILMYSE